MAAIRTKCDSARDPREDVARRDFTINGMLLDPVSGEVLDFVGGRKDLEAGIIRTIGDPERRFGEDKLRMLRAVRFAARFEYAIEPATFAAMQKLAAQIQVVSRERVRDELTRMLTEGHGRRAFLLLDESGLLAARAAGDFCDEGSGSSRRNFILRATCLCTRCCCWRICRILVPLTLAWGALLHDVGKPATFRVAPDRIRFDGHVEVWSEDGGGNLPAAALFERRNGADSGAGRQSHALRPCIAHEGVDAEEISSHARVRRASGFAPGRLLWRATVI